MTQPASGDRRQWILALLEQYEVPLVRFATRMVGDRDAAADVVQHVFLRLCEQRIDELRDRAAPWLFAVCRNKAIDVLRSRGRGTSLAQAEILMSESREPGPAARAERRELYERLNVLVDTLPQSQREALMLWSEGLSYREIAAIIDRTEGNVRVMVHRAMKTLRESPVAQRLLDVRPTEDPLAKRRLQRATAS
jgi:RNA polymerase sigma-70 factor (ECF subfamily)